MPAGTGGPGYLLHRQGADAAHIVVDATGLPSACLPACLQVFSMGDIKPNKVADPEARAALVWILGQFGKHLESRFWPSILHSAVYKLTRTVLSRQQQPFLHPASAHLSATHRKEARLPTACAAHRPCVDAHLCR